MLFELGGKIGSAHGAWAFCSRVNSGLDSGGGVLYLSHRKEVDVRGRPQGVWALGKEC